tara:strand:+ start:911 stop:1687 length:777 start_codon:yes stop_codon:yes gene_type:complete
MDYAYHSEMVDGEKKKKVLEDESIETLSSLKFCNFRTAGFNKRKYPVDFYLLKKMCEEGGILEDAHIFKYLFGLEKREGFAEKEQGFDFYDYEIRFDEWDLFLKFIKFGECKLINGKPEQLMELCNKFGGIPAYDRWYQNIDQLQKKMDNEKYNPMTPQEDTKLLYQWRACPDNRLEWFGKKNKGFSIAGNFKQDTINYTWFWRKLKSNDSKDDDIEEQTSEPIHFAPPVPSIPVNNIDHDMDDMHDFREDTILENFE